MRPAAALVYLASVARVAAIEYLPAHTRTTAEQRQSSPPQHPSEVLVNGSVEPLHRALGAAHDVDVARHLFEEARVVGHEDDAARKALERVAQSVDRIEVEVVGRLVEQQQLGLLEHRARERQPHAPAARQRADRAPHQVLLEADGGHLGGDLVLGALGQVHVDEVDARHLRVRRGDVALDVDGADLLGEPLDHARGDGAHQRRLAGAVGPDEAVALAALELELGVVQQHAVTVREREGAVAEHREVVVVDLFLLLDAGAELLGALLEETLAVDDGLGLRDGGLEVRDDHVVDARPRRREERRGHLRHPLRDLVRVVGVAGQNLGEQRLNLDGRAVDLDGLKRAERHLDGVERLLRLRAHLGHRDLVDVLGEGGDQVGREERGIRRVIDELVHGVDDDG
mmetsp:Transcript_22605/g.70963  ORF Transcript_22605/g.70963 Transcript_22605/m.70963 type:complete len:399 (-) Transcript_22605:785-1981(-)